MFATGFSTENSGNRSSTQPHESRCSRLVTSAPVRRRRKTRRRALVAISLAGVVAGLALPGSGGADPSTSANALRAHQSSLGSRSHAALLSLYSLDARLAQSRARGAALQAQADAVRAQLAQVAHERAIARAAWRASVAALGAHLRTLYEDGQPDAVAVLLGSTSIDEAMTRIDELERTARLNRQTIAQTQRARITLAQAQHQLADHARRLRMLVAAAAQTTAALEQTRAERSAYIASLARERRFTSHRIAQLDAQARASAAQSPPAAQAQTASAPLGAVTSPPATPVAPAGSGNSVTVVATGYSLSGHTATGLPTGWGVVAVDPSVIPLGARLTIPGYGEGVAADTGSAVQGAAIDLWFPTPAQAMAWGRRTVTITVH
jgi:3D (Asp-Asp-Asp) domain-containing protein